MSLPVVTNGDADACGHTRPAISNDENEDYESKTVSKDACEAVATHFTFLYLSVS